MADIRIKDLPVSASLEAGDYVAVDNTVSGTRRFLLQDLVNNFGAPEYVVNVNASGEADKTLSEILSAISDGYVPVVNRVGTYFRLSKVTETGVTFTNNDDPTNVVSIRIISGGTVIEEGSVTSTQVTNTSDVAGAKITDALNDLASNITYAVNDIGTIRDNIDSLDDRVTTLENEGGSSGGGLTQTEKNLILSLFSKAAYAESDANDVYAQLDALWVPSEKTITYNLTDVASSNNATTIESGSGYATALSTRQGYTINNVTVTMGGVDVTSNYYSSGSIVIPRVTGDIVITATAVLSVSSIIATYTQSGTVYDTDSLDSLKSDLVVTATYPDSSTAVIDSADYTLSGILAEGTSVVTVSYGGKTATFEVTVSDKYIYKWDFTQSLTDTKAGRVAELRGTNTAPTQTSTGIVFDAATQNLNLGEIAMKGKTLEVDVASFQFAGSTSNHIRFIMNPITGGTLSGQGALMFRNGGGWAAYGTKSAGSTSGAWASQYLVQGATDAIRNMFNGKTVKLIFDANSNDIDYYADDEHIGTYSEFATTEFNTLVIGGGLSNWSVNNGDQCYNMTISGVRVYANEV